MKVTARIVTESAKSARKEWGIRMTVIGIISLAESADILRDLPSSVQDRIIEKYDLDWLDLADKLEAYVDALKGEVKEDDFSTE